MTQELEWGGVQQILLLVKSALAGVILGFLLDLSSGIRFGVSKPIRFLMDIFVGVLAAVITFFFCLVTTDGRLHPALFIGLAIGAVIEHCLIGRKLCSCIIKIKRFERRMGHRIGRKMRCFTMRSCTFLIRISLIIKKISKNVKKTEKIHRFFQKKS